MRNNKVKERMKKIVLIIVGFMCLGLGAVGVFVPILPTTPFVLVAAACFAGSSEKIYKKLLGMKYFGAYIQNYRNKTGVERKIKIQSLIFLWLMLIISAVIFRKPTVWIILSSVGILVSAHIILIRSKSKECIKFYECPRCGKMIESIVDKSNKLCCCGKKMHEILPKLITKNEGLSVPKVSVKDDLLSVIWEKGAAFFIEGNFVSCVYLYNCDLLQKKYLKSGSEGACVKFAINKENPITLYFYCNGKLYNMSGKDIVFVS